MISVFITGREDLDFFPNMHPSFSLTMPITHSGKMSCGKRGIIFDAGTPILNHHIRKWNTSIPPTAWRI
jgi:hypothetical protein